MTINGNYVAIGIGILGVGFGLWQMSTTNEIVKKLDVTISDIRHSRIDISERVVNSAVERAAKDAAKEAVDRAAHDVVSDCRRQIEASVRSAVADQTRDISKSVAEEITRQASRIDEDALKKEVTKRAEEMIAARFKKTLDEMANKFGKRLDTMNDIYEKLADQL